MPSVPSAKLPVRSATLIPSAEGSGAIAPVSPSEVPTTRGEGACEETTCCAEAGEESAPGPDAMPAADAEGPGAPADPRAPPPIPPFRALAAVPTAPRAAAPVNHKMPRRRVEPASSLSAPSACASALARAVPSSAVGVPEKMPGSGEGVVEESLSGCACIAPSGRRTALGCRQDGSQDVSMSADFRSPACYQPATIQQGSVENRSQREGEGSDR